ncbi:p-aminobenzoic acid synthase [Cystoisospora suis]|uniref:anthranilate synthase n=1 Tax=Cystoisospora suis TaxID=483139 RepID=A0A2C6LH52_9APIC|nr:p-aminobenzoic acid synthase [Cystoisospora suis]
MEQTSWQLRIESAGASRTDAGPNDESEGFSFIRTLLIDNYDSYTYNVFQYLAAVNGVPPVVIRNDEFPTWQLAKARLPLVHNIVISPGPGTVENDEDFGLCREVLQDGAVPVLGICLGHQGLGHVYGGKIRRSPVAIHGRRSPVGFVNEYELFDGVQGGTMVVRYHSLQVERESLPASLEETCWTTDADNVLMGLRHREKPLHGIQFHPESVGTSAGFRILNNFKAMTVAWWQGKFPSQLNAQPPSPVEGPSIPRWCMETASEHPLHWEINVATVALQVDGASSAGETLKEFALDQYGLFEHLYGSDRYCFWLDSSSADELCAGPHAQKTYGNRPCLSFMGSSSGPFGEVIECWELEKATLSHFHGSRTCCHQVEGNVFEVLRSRLAAFGWTPRNQTPRLAVRSWKGRIMATIKKDKKTPEHRDGLPPPAEVALEEAEAGEMTLDELPSPFPCGYAGFFGYEVRHVTEKTGPE